MKDIITLAHGSGGKMTHQLIDSIFHREMANDILLDKGDSAILDKVQGRIAFTTDSYVVTPIFFNGGDIGKISVCGTVNDLSVSGAKPLYLSCGFIIEEGLEVEVLKKIVKSMVLACNEAGVKIVTGDTKVVTKGAADRIFINTTGIGCIPDNIILSQKRIEAGDKVIVSGTIGDHESTILIARENFNIQTNLKSDCAPLNHMLQEVLNKFGNNIHVMRDATRGGLVSTLNEFVQNASLSIRLFEEQIPIRQEVSGLCEMLGLDPLYMANEGKVILVVKYSIANELVNALRSSMYGKDAAVIGEVMDDDSGGRVYIKTILGGSRIVDMLSGEQLPRIC